MKKVKFTLSIGYPTATHSATFEFEDDSTDSEIEECYIDWRNDYLEGSWYVVSSDE